MISLITKESQKRAAKEFFELFKTPWDFYQSGGPHDVVIASGEIPAEIDARIIIVYGTEQTAFDRENNIQFESEANGCIIQFDEESFPVYGKIMTFQNTGIPLLSVKGEKKIAGFQFNLRGKTVVRIGFDLFQEVEFMLSSGQPEEYALYPTLDLHISMLRSLILRSGIPVTEILPVPAGYNFIVCLTHDVDFAGIHRHKCDHTLFGFLYRASVSSFMKFICRKISWQTMLKNWIAVLSLPGIYLGIVKDFWYLFDRYIEIEKGLGSTFFIIPFKKYPGAYASGFIGRARSVKYDISDIAHEVRKLLESGCEIGLHGIDAWRDTARGIEETKKITSVTGNESMGVRMHWLYFSENSSRLLDDAGFIYDSTCGYNHAVGFHAGTAQVFRPLNAKKLLEMPLHIQDTALLSYGRMNLSKSDAMVQVNALIAAVRNYGGALTINWHERSLGPERFWDTFYIDMIRALKNQNPWFGTGTQIVQWFNKRRSAHFISSEYKNNQMQMKISTDKSDGPDLILRIHKPINTLFAESTRGERGHLDVVFSHEVDGVFAI